MRNALVFVLTSVLAACAPVPLAAIDRDLVHDQRAVGNWADTDTDGRGTHRVTADALNVRDIHGSIIDLAEMGQQLVITLQTSTQSGTVFHEAVFKGGALKGQQGWVAGSYLAYAEHRVCANGVAIRDAADLGRVIGTANSGDKAFVISSTVRNTSAHRYFHVSVNGTKGYVATDTLCANGASGGDANLAETILDRHESGQTTLWDQTFGRYDGASPLDNILDTAAGGKAQTSCYGTAPCTEVALDPGMLQGMNELADAYGYSYFVTTIAGASHSSGSLHYAGRAFDIDEINGVRVLGDSALARSFMNACWDLGAVEVFGPSNDPAGHNDHIHCGF